MTAFSWICLALGIVAGLLNAWLTNQNKESNGEKGVQNNRNNKVTIILTIAFVILIILAFIGFSNLGKESMFSGNKQYEEIAQEYIEQASSDYLSYMTLVDTTSYSLDEEVRVTLKYRFTEGPNTSYSTYVVAIDKNTKEIFSFSQY